MSNGSEPQGPAATVHDFLALFLPHARHFLDCAGLITPTSPGPSVFVPLDDPLGRWAVGRWMGMRTAEVATMVALGMGFIDGAFRPDLWIEDTVLGCILPGYIGFRNVFASVALRWGFRTRTGTSDAVGAFPVLWLQPEDLRMPLVVEPQEWALMERGIAVMERVVKGGNWPGGWEKFAITPSGVKKIEPHNADRIAVDLDRNTIAVDGGGPVEVERAVILFAHEIVKARGKPVTFAEMIARHPELEGSNPTRLFKSKPPRELPPEARALMKSGAEGYRVM